MVPVRPTLLPTVILSGESRKHSYLKALEREQSRILERGRLGRRE